MNGTAIGAITNNDVYAWGRNVISDSDTKKYLSEKIIFNRPGVVLSVDIAPSQSSNIYNKTLDTSRIFKVFPSVAMWADTPMVQKVKKSSFRNKREILAFLKLNPELQKILSKAEVVAKKYFSDSKLEVELATDLDTESGEATLFLYIVTRLAPEEALDRMEKMDEEFFGEDRTISSNLFNTNLEFQN